MKPYSIWNAVVFSIWAWFLLYCLWLAVNP